MFDAGRGRAFQRVQPLDRLRTAGPAHLFRRLQARAKRWPIGPSENAAAIILTQLKIGNIGWDKNISLNQNKTESELHARDKD